MLADGRPMFYPDFTDELQYECELVVKIAKNGKYTQEKFAHKYYNEISLGIDFTARDLQSKLKAKGLPWELSKAFDGSAAVGKFIPLTPQMDINNLNFKLNLNGITVQIGHTSQMLFNVNKIIEFTSRYFSLNIGDLIFTGTPAGVGNVTAQDKLEAYLEGNLLLNVEIR